jgi:phosphocarrier protein HPr
MESVKLELELKIVNSHGLHARPAAQFVRIAGRYEDCQLTVSREEMAVNGKSIMGMMMLQAGPGTMIRISAEGEGAEDLCAELKELVEGGFGEQ